MSAFDLTVIGSGPCGYVAAIRAAQLGMKVCVFEGDKTGGACLNQGCIPTKALAASSTTFYNIKRADEFGITVKDCSLDFSKIYERKDNIVKKLSLGIEALMKAKKIELIKEKAEIKDVGHIASIKRSVKSRNILIASGSLPFEVQGMMFDGESIISSSDMLRLRKLPKSIVIVGGGVIGCEFASIFRTFGSEITIVEMMDQLLPSEDREIAKKIEQFFKKRGIKIFTGTKVERIEKAKESVNVFLSNGEVATGEKALIAVGRRPNSKDLGMDAIGIAHNKGWIEVSKDFSTNVKNVYAAGDAIGGILLAHVASREGVLAAEMMSGKESRPLDYSVVPNCIFTYPEIASVGTSENKAKERGMDVRSRKFLFSAIGKSHVSGETEGFVKLVVESQSDKIIGAQIIGNHATELIAELSPCVQYGVTSEKLAEVIHAHPTFSEAIQEASEAIHNKAIHSL